MIYKVGDMLDTIHGILTVQAPLTFKDNTNPKCDKLGNRTLYWLQDINMKDLLFWDTELKNILTENESLNHYNNEDDIF